MVAYTDTEVGYLKKIADQGVGFDAGGDALPSNFDSLASTFTRNPSSSIATEVRTDGVNTWTQTYTRDGVDNITSISKWVKS